MALAEKLLAREFNRPGHAIVDHRTYVFLGDGCMMEGISHEACALAGAWKLNKLVALYDDNGISIDGAVAPWYVDDVRQRFEAYGWQVIGPVDGHDVVGGRCGAGAGPRFGHPADADRLPAPPSAVARRTAPAPPRRMARRWARRRSRSRAQAIGWPHAPFEIPPEVRAMWDARASGAAAQTEWDDRFAAYRDAHPELAAEFQRRMAGALPAQFAQVAVDAAIAAHAKAETVASRKASQIALETFTAAMPELLGGSADLTGSNLTNTAATPALRFDEFGQPNGGRHINYGVREFGMAAVMNGVALHGGFIPYGGTFLTFSDYSRNAIRMAALMKRRVIHVFTHDSIGLGEDGPTHQSVEHAASLRLIPNLDVWRPADTAETTIAWTMALARERRPERAAAEPAEPALPAEGRAGRDRARRLRAGRAGRGRAEGQAARGDPGQRLRSAAGAARAGRAGARAHCGARGVGAQHHGFRPPGRQVQVGRAAGRAAAHRGRGRRHRRLVEVRLRGGGRHRPLRRECARRPLFEHFHLTAGNVAATVRKVLSRQR